MKRQNESTKNLDQSPINTSGQGRNAQEPKEIKNWNWGAFLLTWIWGLSHHVWVSLLSPIAYLACVMMGLTSDLKVFVSFMVIHFIIAIILGLKGNAWAWQKQHYNSVDDFKKREKSWLVAGLVYCLLIIIAMHYMIFMLLFSLIVNPTHYDYSGTGSLEFIR